VLDPLLGTLESGIHAADVRLVDGAAEATAMLIAHGIPVAVVSNQPAAAKGIVSVDELRAVLASNALALGSHAPGPMAG
jgi:hypothetical protein